MFGFLSRNWQYFLGLGTLVLDTLRERVELGLRDQLDPQGQLGLLMVRLQLWLLEYLSYLGQIAKRLKQLAFGCSSLSWQYFRESGALVLDTLRERVELDLRDLRGLRGQRGLLTVRLTV